MSSYAPEPAFEDVVRRGLAGLAAEVAVPPLQRRAKGRVRRRQVTTVLAALSIASLAFAGGLTAWQELFPAEEYVEVGSSGRLLNTRGAGGNYPCSQEDIGVMGSEEHSCVAVGSFRGLSWMLGASLDEKHGLCIVTGTPGGGNIAGGMGASCDGYTEGEISLSQSRLGDLPMLAAGAVPGDTERLYLETADDDPMELQVYPTPADFPLDVKFYLVWLPDDARSLVAVDDSEEVIATRSLDGSNGGDGQENARHVTLSRGSIDGGSWELDTYGDTIDGRELICTQLRFDFSDERNETGICHPEFADQRISAHVEDRPVLRGRIAISGVMTDDVVALELHVGGEIETEVAIIVPPDAIDQSLRFFVGFPRVRSEDPLSGVLVGRNEAGRVVARDRF